MVRGKRHPDSREKWAATRLPRGAQRFASLPGSLQALTHQSRACHLLCAPPPRSRAHQPPTFRPPPFSYLLDCRLTLFPCFPYPPASSLTPCHPFPANLPLPPPNPSAQHRVDRRTPSVICPRDPATLRHAEKLKNMRTDVK